MEGVALDERGRRSGAGRDETEEERLDRNLEELLGELRVALRGVQVLFAFLLVVPFSARFAGLTPGQERLYLATLLSAGLASAFLIAPTAHHRMTFRLQDKEHLVLVANRLAILGLTFLALSMTGCHRPGHGRRLQQERGGRERDSDRRHVRGALDPLAFQAAGPAREGGGRRGLT